MDDVFDKLKEIAGKILNQLESNGKSVDEALQHIRENTKRQAEESAKPKPDRDSGKETTRSGRSKGKKSKGITYDFSPSKIIESLKAKLQESLAKVTSNLVSKGLSFFGRASKVATDSKETDEEGGSGRSKRGKRSSIKSRILTHAKDEARERLMQRITNAGNAGGRFVQGGATRSATGAAGRAVGGATRPGIAAAVRGGASAAAGGSAGGGAGAGAAGAAGGAAAAAGTALIVVAAAVAAVVATIAAIKKFVEITISMAKTMIESAKELAQFNGRLATAFAKSEVRSIQRNINSGKARSESAANLIEKFDELKDAVSPLLDQIRRLIDNILAAIIGFFTQVINGVKEWVDLSGILDTLNGILEENKKANRKDELLPGESFLVGLHNKENRRDELFQWAGG